MTEPIHDLEPEDKKRPVLFLPKYALGAPYDCSVSEAEIVIYDNGSHRAWVRIEHSDDIYCVLYRDLIWKDETTKVPIVGSPIITTDKDDDDMLPHLLALTRRGMPIASDLVIREEQSKPYVVALIKEVQSKTPRSTLYYLCIRNDGNGRAYDIKINSDIKETPETTRLLCEPFIQNGIPYLGPCSEKRVYLFDGTPSCSSPWSSPFRIVINYRNGVKEVAENAFTIDIRQYASQ